MAKKQKNVALVIGFGVSLMLCYHLALAKTLALKNEYMQLKKQEVLSINLPKQVSLLKQKQKHYSSLLLKYRRNGSSVQNNLLRTINAFADSTQMKVVSFLEPHSFLNKGLMVNTYQFTLEGQYNHLIKLIHMLEQQTKFGEITNLHFEKKKNFRTGTFYLQLHVLLKSLG